MWSRSEMLPASTNPGGNEPQGSGASNGQAIDYQNPAGHAPFGWNK